MNCGFVIDFCVVDTQLLCHQKIPKIWTCLPSCLHLFNFGSLPSPFKHYKLKLNTHSPALPLPPSPPPLTKTAFCDFIVL